MTLGTWSGDISMDFRSPSLVPTGKMTSEPMEKASSLRSTTSKDFILNCRLSDAPQNAAPRTAASSVFTFWAIFSSEPDDQLGFMDPLDYVPRTDLIADWTIGTRVFPPKRIKDVMLSSPRPELASAACIGKANCSVEVVEALSTSDLDTRDLKSVSS